MNAVKPLPRANQFFEIRLNSVASGVPLLFDIYLFVNQKPVLFRRIGDSLTSERMQLLLQHGGEKFLVPEEQRAVYLASLQNIIRNPSTSREQKAKFIKESAFVHVQDLFTKQEIRPVVTEAKNLVEEMVHFVSADIAAVSSLMRLSAHDYYTYNHCVDVAVYSIVLAKKLFGEDKNILMAAGLGGLLHDIGKRKIDLNIINKTSALTPQEWDEIKRHPTYGRDYLSGIASIPAEARRVVYEHHENFDGTGYPTGLRADDISKVARVVTIADVFDALTTNRAYHKAITPAEALNTMFGMQPGKFDPQIFRAFNKNFDKRANLMLTDEFDPCQPGAIHKIKKT